MGIRQRRTAETKTLLLEAGLSVFAERGIEFATLDDIAQTAGFTKGAIYRQFPSKGAFLLALFEQYAAVARAGAGARQAPWFIPLPCSSPPTRCAIRCSSGALPSSWRRRRTAARPTVNCSRHSGECCRRHT